MSASGETKSASAEIFAAWRSELSAAAGDVFAGDRSEVLAHYVEGRIVVSGPADARRDAVLVLPPDGMLEPVLRLPSASHAVLRSALNYELEKLSPIPPEQVYFDFRVTGRDHATKSAEIALRIIRRDIVDDALRQCRAAGLAIGTIRFGSDPCPADRRHFPVDRKAWLLGLWRRQSVALLGGAVLALLLAVLLAAYLRGASTLDALTDELLDAGAHASRAEQLQQRIARASTQLAFLSEQKRAPLFAATLAEVTRTLPDGSWLTELDLSGGKIRIEGYSPAAADLIAVFDRSGRFANAQFAAPVTQGPQPGIERFDLTFEIAGAKP